MGLNYKYLYILLIILSCTKKQEFSTDKKYFFKGLFIIGENPYYQIEEVSLNKKALLVSHQKISLFVIDQNNIRYDGRNGRILNMPARSNQEYIINWKHKNSSVWHKFTKRTPKYDSAFHKENEIAFQNKYVLRTSSKNQFLKYTNDTFNNANLPNVFFNYCCFNELIGIQKFNRNNNDVIIWPLTNYCAIEYPFNKFNKINSNEFQILEIPQSDLRIKEVLNRNYKSRDEVFLTPKLLDLDYASGNNLAHIFTIKKHSTFNYQNFIPQTKKLFFKVKNLQNFELGGIVMKHPEFLPTDVVNSLRPINKTNGYLSNAESIFSFYRLKYPNTCTRPSEIPLKIKYHWTDTSGLRPIYYSKEIDYIYKFKSDTVVLTIP